MTTDTDDMQMIRESARNFAEKNTGYFWQAGSLQKEPMESLILK